MNYLPIVMAAFWFGWRGGVGAALLITFILLPDLFLLHWRKPSDLNSFLEIFLYNAVGLVTGALSSAEMRQRQRYNEMVVQLAKAEHLAQLGEGTEKFVFIEEGDVYNRREIALGTKDDRYVGGERWIVPR